MLSLNWKRLSSKIQQEPSEGKSEREGKKGRTSSRPNSGKVTKKGISAVRDGGLKIAQKRASKQALLATRNSSSTSKESFASTVSSASASCLEKKKEVSKDIIDPEMPHSLISRALWDYDRGLTVEDIHKAAGNTQRLQNSRKREMGRYVSLDCEFVGVGPEGTESALARVSFVNFYGHVIYDRFVRPREKVTDWRTWVSGVTPQHMKDAVLFKQAQEESAKILENRILVGHAVHHDLESLFLSHSRSQIRDTSKFTPFRAISNGRTPSLKKLIKHFLQMDIQDGSHSSVEDAQATMLLYRLHRDQFEKSMRAK